MRMRSGNPSLNKKTFQNITRTGPIIKDDLMTISGTVDKTGICLAVLLFAAYFTYGPNGTSYIFLGGFGGLAVAIAIRIAIAIILVLAIAMSIDVAIMLVQSV